MNSKASWSFLFLITLFHVGGIALVVSATESTEPEVVVPTIQGVLITPEKKEVIPVPPEPPKPKPKKIKQKHKPVPKAPPSERAIKAEPEPVPEPEPQPEPMEEPEPAPVIPPSTDAYELKNPAPAYPQLSKKLKEEGTVTLKILVKADGKVAKVEIIKSSGFRRLDNAAISAFKRWHFSPATQGGIAIDYSYEIDFEFGLKKK